MANKKDEKVEKLNAEFEELKKSLQQRESLLVESAQLDDDQREALQDRLYKMIDYTGRRHDWYVDQCHRLLQIGLALVASGGAIGAIFGKLDHLARPTQYLAWVFALSLFAVGMFLVYLYNNYLAGDHPYRKVVDISSWFFKYRFPHELSPNLSRSPEKAKQQVSQEAEYIEKFFDNFLPHAKKDLSLIREDIEQVTILLILQRYRAQQVSAMAKSLYRGLLLSTLVFVLLVLSSLFASGPKQAGSESSAASGPTIGVVYSPTASQPITSNPGHCDPTSTRPAGSAKQAKQRKHPVCPPSH